MLRSTFVRSINCSLVALALAACGDDPTEPETDYLSFSVQPGNGTTTIPASSGFDPEIVAALAAGIEAFNAAQAAAGSTMRLDYPWMFVVGQGTDPFMRLRIGARWTVATTTFVLDESDFTTDLTVGTVDATLLSAFRTWESVEQSFLRVKRVADSGRNFDVLDGIVRDAEGNCRFPPFDPTSPNLLGLSPESVEIEPAADMVVGGWVAPEYFSDCLGNPNILGVTWTLSDFDSNGDQYPDLVYVEQFYNPRFRWVTTGSVYLTFPPDACLVDLQSIAVHENGHALGLGHFGGPVRNQPFKLKPNLRVFNPEAVMNGGYLCGEKRDLHPTDEAALRTLYTGLR